MQVTVKVGITMKASGNHMDLAALQALAEAGLTLIAVQFVSGRIVIGPISVVTFGAFEDPDDQKDQAHDQENKDQVIHTVLSMDRLSLVGKSITPSPYI
jgi:hypothetical protein